MIKKLCSVLCALALIAPVAPAQTLLEVTTNASDNSAGSLGAILNAPTANALVIFSPFLSPVIAPKAAYPVGVSMSLYGNQQVVNFNGAAGLSITGGVFGINGLTASGITVSGGGTLSTSFSSISGLTLNGGTYQTLDNSFTAGTIINGAGLGTNNIDVFGNNPTMSGITGVGDLTVVDSSLLGNGILTLNGVNTYTGATFVKSGTLQLGINSALVATGNLTTAAAGTFDLNGFNQTLAAVTNAGTVKTGFGTLTAGSFAGAGTLSVGLKSGLTNLVVTGAATLAGPLVVTGHPAAGVYTVVNAGTLAGQFSAITVPFGVTDSIAYVPGLNGTAIIDILSDTPFTIAGQSPNQAAIGRALNSALTNGSGSAELTQVLAQISGLSPAQTNAVIDQIGPISYAALSGMSFAGSGIQAAAVNQRLTGLQAGRQNGDGTRFASMYPGTLVAELPGDSTAADAGDRDRLFDSGSPWGLYVSGLGTFNRLNSINGAAGSQPGYSDTATGGTLGLDYRFNEHFAAGVAGGYVNSYAKIDSDGGTVYGQSARLGVYGTAYNDAFHGNLFLGGAHDFYGTSRNVTALSRTATASPAGSEFNMDALAGWDVKTAHADVSPFVELAYDRLMLGSFTESGAGALNLAMAAQTAESLRSTLGVKVSRRFKPDWCDLTPYASAGWQHELDNQSRALTASLAGGTGSFTVNTADVSREAALLGAGLDMDWTPGFSMRFGYQSTLRSDFSAKTVNGSMRWRF